MPSRPAREQPLEVHLSQVQRQIAQVVAAHGEDVEGIELHFMIVLRIAAELMLNAAIEDDHLRFAVVSFGRDADAP